MSDEKWATVFDAAAGAAREGRALEPGQIHELAAAGDLIGLGALADEARRRRSGTDATFVRVHTLAIESQAAWQPVPATAHEVRLVGAPPSMDAALDAVLQAKTLAGGVVLRGFSLRDIWALDGEEGCRALAAAGLDEIAWCHVGPGVHEAMAAARNAGLGVRVLGVDDEPARLVDWLLEARELQATVGGLHAVAPLPRVVDAASPTTGYADVRRVALTRLVLTDIPSVQVDWALYGPKLAQVALTVGADDLDSVAAADDLSHGARRATLEDVRRNIVAAGLVAVERTGRHERI